jgi:outer membrane protein OmpA-like peptidoglycan-associated protein
MKREIEAKIQNQASIAVQKLQRYEDIRILMATQRAPRAIGIPPEMLFGSGIQFKKDAVKVLDLLTELLFNLGASQIVILPEGALVGNAKILDMRRITGISAHFYHAGIAPPRVKLNILGSQVEIPREIQDFKGILLLFTYNQPLQLSSDTSIDETGGPPLSLGASPASLDPSKNEGAIVEFSVVEPPAGLMSWRFQLLGPGGKGSDDLRPLQEVKGSGPVFHQIFWNGKKNYFGDPYPSGQYEAILTGTDQKNRTRKKHLWISLEGSAPIEPPPAAPAPALAKVPISDIAPPGRVVGVEIAPRSRRKAKNAPPPARPGKKTPAAKPSPKAAEAAPPQAAASSAPAAMGVPAAAPQAKAGVVNFQVSFLKNGLNMTGDSDSNLARLADSINIYPESKITIVGCAFKGENNPADLALKRGEFVKKRLTEQFRLKAPMDIRTKVQDVEEYKADIYIVKGG